MTTTHQHGCTIGSDRIVGPLARLMANYMPDHIVTTVGLGHETVQYRHGNYWIVSDASWVTDDERRSGRAAPAVAVFFTSAAVVEFIRMVEAGEIETTPHEAWLADWPGLQARVGARDAARTGGGRARSERHDLLLRDAEARQRGENLDGSPRREDIFPSGQEVLSSAVREVLRRDSDA